MAAASDVSVSGTSCSKWQIAILIGAPVAVGVGIGCWYFKSKKSNSDDGGKVKKNGPSNSTGNNCAVTIDDADGDHSLMNQYQCKSKGNELFKKGRFKDAIIFYDAAIMKSQGEKSRPSDVATYFQNRAAAYEQLKMHEEVITACNRALELNPKYVKALHRRAKACEIQKDLQQSLEDLTAACILEGFQNQTTLMAADRVLKELGRLHAKESMADRIPVMPADHFVQTYFSSFSEDPTMHTDVDLANNEKGFPRAKAAFLAQDYGEIVTACSEELDNADGMFKCQALLLRATFNLLLGDHDLAVADFNCLIRDNNAPVKLKVNALIKRASLYMQIEKIQQCFDDFQSAIDLDKTNSDIYHHRGQVHLLIDKVTEAMDDFNRAVSLKPNFPIAYVQKCYTEYRYAFSTRDLSRIHEVMNSFKEAIISFPNCSECYTLYAQILSDQQEYKQADENFSKAIDVEPNNATLYVHRGLLQLQWTGNIPKAIELIQKAIQKDHRCVFALETLGTIEVQRGNLNQAVELFNKAIPFAKTELERAHLFSLRDAAVAQSTVAERMGILVTGVAS